MVNLGETTGRKLLDSSLVNDFLKLYTTKPTRNRTRNIQLGQNVLHNKEDNKTGWGMMGWEKPFSAHRWYLIGVSNPTFLAKSNK